MVGCIRILRGGAAARCVCLDSIGFSACASVCDCVLLQLQQQQQRAFLPFLDRVCALPLDALVAESPISTLAGRRLPCSLNSAGRVGRVGAQ